MYVQVSKEDSRYTDDLAIYMTFCWDDRVRETVESSDRHTSHMRCCILPDSVSD